MIKTISLFDGEPTVYSIMQKMIILYVDISNTNSGWPAITMDKLMMQRFSLCHASVTFFFFVNRRIMYNEHKHTSGYSNDMITYNQSFQ